MTVANVLFFFTFSFAFVLIVTGTVKAGGKYFLKGRKQFCVIIALEWINDKNGSRL